MLSSHGHVVTYGSNPSGKPKCHNDSRHCEDLCGHWRKSGGESNCSKELVIASGRRGILEGVARDILAGVGQW